MEPVKAPWIKPAAVVHDPQADVDELLADFALDIRARGFRVAGLVQLNNRRVDAPGAGCANEIELFDLGSGEALRVRRGDPSETAFLGIALASPRAALRDDADLVVISRFGALDQAASRLMTAIEDGIAQGLPVLTSIAGLKTPRTGPGVHLLRQSREKSI